CALPIFAAKDARPQLDRAVREVLRDPVLEGREVSIPDLNQLIDLVVAGDPLQHLARIAWRALLAEGEPERRMALEAIDEGVRALDTPAQQKKPKRLAPPPGQKEAEEAVKRAERAEREREAMKQQLAQAPQAQVPQAEAERHSTASPADLPSEEEASTFLVPVLTREFYDSIERWDRRMQRAAIDKIHRLANDWRHGSLRALALEGVPGYYRIRVATDVRLIYRRDGNRLEVLSLIDREDLDR